ncbi:MAG: S8 family peptidase [Gammaproteobacteria bacterium]|nr:S8 family peptidase [Gammaproteobacteria bacterium]
MQRIRVAISCFALVGLVCLSVFLHEVIFKPEHPQKISDTEFERTFNPGMNTSQTESTRQISNSPHVTEEAPELASVESSNRSSSESTESTNIGVKTFELTDFRGEMKKGKLAQRPSVDVNSHPSLSWFTKDASTISFPDSEESLNRDYFYAWIQLNPNVLHTIERDTFKSLGVEIYDGGNEYRRVRLPRDTGSLKQLLAHESVLALGNKPISEKIGPNFREEIYTSVGSETKKVFITLMTTTNLTHWRSEIEELGAVIEHWDPTIRVLAASVPYGKLIDLAEWDFVQAVEPVGTLELSLDSAVPVSGADGLRTHQAINGSFVGITGANITIGVIDSGLNLSHPDISSTRDSICGESFQTMDNGQLDTDDLWVDLAGHGTHVTSIFAGAGVDDRSRAGFAPGVKHIRFAKAFAKDDDGADTTSTLKSIDYLTQESSCEWNGTESVAMKPNIINVSLGIPSADTGDRVGAKKLDWAVWNHNQVYVVSQGNWRRSAYSHYASAKNSLSVAWLTDALFANFFTSFGPAVDGRMTPNVGMTGDFIQAADGNGAESGYVTKNGSSMSSPAVAGIATLLMGTDDGFKTNPALVRAQLMATAIKPDAYFDSEAFAPRTNTYGTGFVNNQYGMGSVSARTALIQGPNNEWSSHSAVSEIENDEYAYIEIEVPENTDRLDIVLTWDEPPSDEVGSTVMADLDLYLGPDEDCDVTECGEHVSSSRVDNLEYLIIANPEAGTKRITVIPHNVFQFAPRIAVSWMLIGKSTPQLDIELESDTLNTANVRRPQLELTVSTDEFVAGGVALHIACRDQRTGDCDYVYNAEESFWQPGSQITREDGTVQDLAGISIGRPIFLGEVVSGEVQNVALVFPPEMKTGSHQLYVSVASTNAMADVDTVDVLVDGQDLPSPSAALSNNYATSAVELPSDSGTVSVDLIAGTRDPGELYIDTEVLAVFVTQRDWEIDQYFVFTQGYSQSRSAWYKLSTSTPVKYRIQLTSQDPRNANVSFQLISEDNMFLPPPGNMWTTDFFEFYLQAHTDYYLRVNTYWSLRAPELEFTWEKFDAKPVNDDFADSIALSGENGDVTGNNAYATVEQGEPGGHVSVGTTWFTWTAPSDGVWTFEADAPYSDERPNVYVFLGDSVDDLRLVSDPAYYNADIPVSANQEYKICVSTDAEFSDFEGSYELSWEESSTSNLMSNDMFSNAIEISGAQGSRTKCSTCSGVDRTIEVGEPAQTISHSLWWAWEAPGTGRFTFRLSNAQIDVLSAFVGSTLSTLTHLATGQEFVLDVNSGTTYYIVIHRNSGLEYSFDVSNNSFLWGATPENDSISAATSISGTTGDASWALKYATTTPDESRANGLTSAGVHSSVWGEWTPTAGFNGWMEFSTETWEDASLRSASDQYFLAIHKRDDDDDPWDLIASTDRSFIISGRPEAIFKPEAGAEYLVQVAMRSNRTEFSTSQTEVDIFWREARIPSWITSSLDFQEIGSPTGHNIEELINPTAGAVVGSDLDKVLIAVEDEMLVLGLSDDTDDLSVVETIPYEDADGETVDVPDLPVLGWNAARGALYAPLRTGFVLFEGLDQTDRTVSNCSVESDFRHTPTQVLHDGTGRYIYKIGLGTIATYRVDGPCEMSLIQVATSSSASHALKTEIIELTGLRFLSFDPIQDYLYGLSDDRIFTFGRDDETGMLSISSTTTHTSWLTSTGLDENSNRFDGASITLDASGDYLFVVGQNNPAVAVFDISSENRSTPLAIAAIDNYYINDNFPFFPSHIRRPDSWDSGQCLVNDVHRTEYPAIEVFCRYMNYVVTFDESTRELYISDWSSNEQPDRYGNQLPEFNDMVDAFGVSTQNGKFSYVVVDDWIDSIHRFERVTGANDAIPRPTFDLYDQYLVRLVAMNVEPSSIQLDSLSITECEAFDNRQIGDVSYTVHSSAWQFRNSLGENWTDVDGEVRTTNELCPYNPPDARDYRLVFNVTIDGSRGDYSSDVMAVAPDN